MSDVTPSWHHWHPWNSPETPQNTPNMIITNFNYKGSFLSGVICNIVVKADLGRSPGRSTPQCWHLVIRTGNWQICQQIYPPVLTSSGQDWQLADLPGDPPTKCIMGYILWNVFGSHFGFFKKRWEFSLISE